MFLAIALLTALFYSVAERKSRDSFTIKRNGALTFWRIGRVSGSYCIRKG